VSALGVGELATQLSPECGLIVERQAPGAAFVAVHQDARRVEPGSLFVARPGLKVHGAQFIPQALARGALGVLTDLTAVVPPEATTVLRARDLSLALAQAAHAVYGYPGDELMLSGVTGTNGKTSVVWAVQRALDATGSTCARLGTLGFACGAVEERFGLTTPEVDACARYLRTARSLGASHATLEVTSVALASGRIEGLHFQVGAFTNLTQDHLDYHGSFSAYRAAKATFFLNHRPPTWVLNIDDPFGAELASQAPPGVRVLRVGRHAAADLRMVVEPGIHAGIRAEYVTADARGRLHSDWLGLHNLENLAVALGVLWASGVELELAAATLAGIPPPPGRLERCDEPGDGFQVVVDYAHTDDALRRVLLALRPHTLGRIVCVFGCGGDRDPGKRVLMGAAAGELADYSIVTSDNPRSESPRVIAERVVAGLAGAGGRFEIELDRRRAIERAVNLARSGDTVLIAGKGHETEQITAEGSVPFDDRSEARAALEQRRQLLGL
jgi:UDP-N-acetylmuramoyl-L-alanyl-D-glutamate--2,6-diaminopimelate ligase